MQRIFECFLIGICGSSFCIAQQSITIAGGEAAGTGGSMSYSSGQVVYTTNTGTNGSVAQGIQQPYEISVETGIEETESIPFQCSIYPNPITENLVLKIEKYDMENLLYQLCDMNGRILENNRITGNENIIVMSRFVPGTYFLRITVIDKEVKTFKIIKN